MSVSVDATGHEREKKHINHIKKSRARTSKPRPHRNKKQRSHMCGEVAQSSPAGPGSIFGRASRATSRVSLLGLWQRFEKMEKDGKSGLECSLVAAGRRWNNMETGWTGSTGDSIRLGPGFRDTRPRCGFSWFRQLETVTRKTARLFSDTTKGRSVSETKTMHDTP